MSKASLIMLIRHAEKADEEQGGVDRSGDDNRNSLSVRGWQRAGALVPFFASSGRPMLESRLAQPTALIAEFADAPGSEEKHSKREEQTLFPLAKKLGLSLDFSFGKGQEQDAAQAAKETEGVVLLAWEHKELITLAHALAPEQAFPDKWPKERYDVVFVFRLVPGDGTYTFEEVPQLLLEGDTANPIVETA